MLSLPVIYSQERDKVNSNYLIKKTMIRLNVFVRVNESNREEAIKAAKELTACSLKEEGCILYSEMLTDFERIGDHALNIAQEMTKMVIA